MGGRGVKALATKHYDDPRHRHPPTECNNQRRLFQDLRQRKVEAEVSGGYLSNDGGLLMPRRAMPPKPISGCPS
jgi:hypothetical protein